MFKTGIRKLRVKPCDVKQGKVFYRATVHGIYVVKPLTKPFVSTHTESLFVYVKTYPISRPDLEHTAKASLMDYGIIHNTYNTSNCFFKLKHAEQWVAHYEKWGKPRTHCPMVWDEYDPFSDVFDYEE